MIDLKKKALEAVPRLLNASSSPYLFTRVTARSTLFFFFWFKLSMVKPLSIRRCLRLLTDRKISSKIAHHLMQKFLSSGRLELAKAAALKLLASEEDDYLAQKRLEIQRMAGTICFLLGENKEANHHWKLSGELRRTFFKKKTPREYRILGASWFAAVGHVAMLDFYLKYKRLYGQQGQRIVAIRNGPHFLRNLGCAFDLMKKFAELGIEVLSQKELERDYNRWAKDNKAPKWRKLSESEKQAMVDDFWEFEFPDGAILGYAHANARIQKEWEASDFSPLFHVNASEKDWIDRFRSKIGLPQDAWFVCIHVRENGYHKKWNANLPAMRDSNIDDYAPAMQEIVNAGGWVLRMGDPSMKKLPPMRHVIDYAHHPERASRADVLLAGTCRFYLGTNSGFAMIPAIYGIPCAYSNWIPIGWPMWASQDLLACKLFREKSTGQFLTLEQIFDRGLAFLQNVSDLPAEFELVDNTPEDIRQLTLEMLQNFPKVDGSTVHEKYLHIARLHETFASARFADTFVKTYPGVFV